MGEADAVGAYLLYKLHILTMVGLGDGPAFAGTVLMTVDPAYIVGTAVETQPFAMVDSDSAETHRLRHFVNYPVAVGQSHGKRIKRRRTTSVPQQRICHSNCVGNGRKTIMHNLAA